MRMNELWFDIYLSLNIISITLNYAHSLFQTNNLVDLGHQLMLHSLDQTRRPFSDLVMSLLADRNSFLMVLDGMQSRQLCIKLMIFWV
jgi:hypothetical protein